jgi:hypothetical protein
MKSNTLYRPPLFDSREVMMNGVLIADGRALASQRLF